MLSCLALLYTMFSMYKDVMLSVVNLSVVVPFVRHTAVMLSVLMYSDMLTVTMRYNYAQCS